MKHEAQNYVKKQKNEIYRQRLSQVTPCLNITENKLHGFNSWLNYIAAKTGQVFW